MGRLPLLRFPLLASPVLVLEVGPKTCWFLGSSWLFEIQALASSSLRKTLTRENLSVKTRSIDFLCLGRIILSTCLSSRPYQTAGGPEVLPEGGRVAASKAPRRDSAVAMGPMALAVLCRMSTCAGFLGPVL